MTYKEFDDLDEIELSEDDKAALPKTGMPNRRNSPLPDDEEVLQVTKVKQGKNKKQPTVLSELISYLQIIVAAILIALICINYVIVNAVVPTGSMNNTIMEGDKLIGFRLAYLFNEPKRFDIVIFKFPDDESQIYVKRIIGLPGDIVEVKGGHVYVNGEELNESYIKAPMVVDPEDKIYTVPEDSYFMLGDNRNSSQDSRLWTNKYVKKDKILAKAIFKYYPSIKLLK